MKEFAQAVKFKIIPTTFVYRCSICGFETTDYDRNFGLIKMNEHILTIHPKEVKALDKEELFSRKSQIVLDSF